MKVPFTSAGALARLRKPENLTKLPAIVAAGQKFITTDIPAYVQAHLVASVPNIDPALVAWGNVVEYL